MKYGLTELMQKYRRSPEFFFVDLTDPNQTGMTGDTLLHSAVINEDLRDVELLLTSGVSVNAVGDLGNTPLHHAASLGLVGIVTKLLQSGADASITNEFGQTALDLAAVMNRSEVIKVLTTYKSR
jgi:uncharacterized protein